MPATDHATRLVLDSHEDRIQTVEKAMVDFVGTVKPSLARLEEGMGHVNQKVDSMAVRLDSGSEKFVDQNQRLRDLEFHVSGRTEKRKRYAKWVAGLAATVIGALILGMFGL